MVRSKAADEQMARNLRSAMRRAAASAVAAMFVASMMLMFVPADRGSASAPLGRIVALDPGHGGDEPGATGGGVVERDSNLDMALRVRALLMKAGVDVVMTRMNNGRAEGLDTGMMSQATATFADLQARVARVDAARADAFVSLHSNSFRDPTVGGIEAWYNPARPFAERNRLLADLLRTHVAAELAASGFVAPPSMIRDETGQMDANGRTTPFFVLGPARDVSRGELAQRGVDPGTLGLAADAGAFRAGETNAPGVLLELLYLSNPYDAELLRNETARNAMASGITRAILDFLAMLPAQPSRGAG